MPSSFSTLDAKKILITGGGGGIGKAFAQWLLGQDKQVILVGRTESNLASTSKELGNVPYYVFDAAHVSEIKPFVAKVVREHPDVDGLINNAGVQRELYVEHLNLAKLDEEIDTNVRAPIHLIDAFLPHFKNLPGALIVNVSSVLGLVPFNIVNPGYNGTKAYLHFYTLALRAQLKQTNIKVVEVLPPGVKTDLHRDRLDPGDNKGPQFLPLEDFVAEVAQGWKDNLDQVTAGPGHKILAAWDENFGVVFDKAAQAYDPATARAT